MPHVSGTANSPDDLRVAISAFATRTLGNFDDAFGGALGLSAFGGDSVLGLRHRTTGAVYLFDVVSGLNMNNLPSEHVLLGQLLTSASGALTYDANQYFGQEGDQLLQLLGQDNISWATLTNQTRPGFSGLFNLTTFTVNVTEGTGPLSQAEVGRALVVKHDFTVSGVTYSQHVFEIIETSVEEGATDGLPHPTLAAPAYQQKLVGIYIGSYNNDGTNAVGTSIPDLAAPPENILLSNFNARDSELLSSTAFNDFATSMWGELTSAADISEGYFPRSGRLNFTDGVNYEFYGSPEVGNEHFHMVLQTEGDPKRTHWWLGRLSNDAEYLTTDQNSTGMFLGTSGPHTDAQGVDTYQYPFSYKAANEVYKNPCIVAAIVTNDGSGSSVRQKDGGRLGYGPTGANHQRKYGPNETHHLFLQSQSYSIQSGFNSFEGSEALGMTGARARTFFPLRVSNPSAFGFYSDYHISPWAPVEAVLHGLPMPTARAAIQTEDAILEAEDIANLAIATGGTALSATSGWAEQQFSGVDPQTHFWRANGADGLAHVANATYDKIEFRVRLKTPAVGGTLASSGQGQIFITNSTSTSYGDAGNLMQFDHPASFDAGEWTTYSLDPSVMAGWVNTITGLRVDMFHYNTAPSTGLRLEWDYISVGQTRLQRNSLYAYNNGGYAIHLGQFPGVGRITMHTGIVSLEPDSKIVTEAGSFDSVPVTIRGTTSQYQRPLDPTDHSGLAGYVYER
jgi:hypothetical protein